MSRREHDLSPRASDPTASRLTPASLGRCGDDPIFVLNAEATARARTGEDVLNATLGSLLDDDLELALLPVVAEAQRRVPARRAAAYAPIAGPPAFLAGVREELFGSAGSLAESALAVASPGATGAIYQAVVSFLAPGERLLTTSHHWSPYAAIAEQAGRGLATFEMFDADGALDVAALQRALELELSRQGRALLVLNTPCHNPTGYSLDRRDWERLLPVLLSAAERAPLCLLLDLAYASFGRQAPRSYLQPLEALLGRASLLVAWTASKAYTQYGARVGACVALEGDPLERERVRSALGHVCRGTWSNCNHLGMLAITELLTDPELRERAERERAQLVALLSGRVELFGELCRAAGLSHPRYEGGFFVAVFSPDAEHTAAHMRARGVFVVPLQGAVRVALCATPRSRIPRPVEALEAGVRAAGG
jgi:aromatic-amino-acid transaminase